MIRLFVALGVVVLLAAGGCSRSGLVPAQGKLTQGGIPVANAAVILHYPSKDFCMGSTDSQGVFILTYNGKPGARPGKQIAVTVVKYDAPASENVVLPTPVGIPPVENRPTMTPKDTRTKPPGKNLLPAEYGDPQNPKLKIDIPAGGSDKLVIALP